MSISHIGCVGCYKPYFKIDYTSSNGMRQAYLGTWLSIAFMQARDQCTAHSLPKGLSLPREVLHADHICSVSGIAERA